MVFLDKRSSRSRRRRPPPVHDEGDDDDDDDDADDENPRVSAFQAADPPVAALMHPEALERITGEASCAPARMTRRTARASIASFFFSFSLFLCQPFQRSQMPLACLFFALAQKLALSRLHLRSAMPALRRRACSAICKERAARDKDGFCFAVAGKTEAFF